MGLIGYNECNYSDDLFFIQVVGTTAGKSPNSPWGSRSIGGTYTIYKAYVSGLNFREHPPKIWPEIWYVYVPP